MKLIFHRRNTVSDLMATDSKYGVEVDIRSEGDRLIIHHDPCMPGEHFDEWINAYRHGTLILNVKEEGLEARLISLMESKSISDYFFLDQSFPFLVKWSNAGEHRCAVRISEFESIETALNLAGKVDWVWVDCFTHFPLNEQNARRLKDAGFKLCLVSPELQGRDPEIEIFQLASLLKERNILADAVCTKRPDLWEKTVAFR
ncbi:phosphatidylinositol-specific phospholipase C/glycerophosphodiester phosphodiesterase family protein [Crenobacter sp. SG2303]|uniref:Phosphatidylinositol-specific phospholipase C/glycerophosphodiester phosphodiesterase family protein n=1 Tax=Crenobacter oryzisoli TaxID=3056844 RepID=A0ABT7XSR6_9NEIS|nr:phosphatidylinositol-specific phospholipase C/glycerophosphodiester phosphodiesterase family protein [Crenobacter sp. SG2303]MDN0076834.1 phosphatidylinositol-specific phospholipase C/glycerophosphodiester phosphodiesterase family protein [Crenobacter sp. SG2303]